MTAVASAAAFVLHGIGMFALFTKMNNIFNPNRITPQLRHKQRLNRLRL